MDENTATASWALFRPSLRDPRHAGTGWFVLSKACPGLTSWAKRMLPRFIPVNIIPSRYGQLGEGITLAVCLNVKQEKREEMSDVVIIGAGLAGLSCAVSLEGAGIPVTLLEAATRQVAGYAETWSKAFAWIAAFRCC